MDQYNVFSRAPGIRDDHWPVIDPHMSIRQGLITPSSNHHHHHIDDDKTGERCASAWAVDEGDGSRGRGGEERQSKGGRAHDDDDEHDDGEDDDAKVSWGDCADDHDL